MTYPLIGNIGLADEDYESRMIALGAMIVRDLFEEKGIKKDLRHLA